MTEFQACETSTTPKLLACPARRIRLALLCGVLLAAGAWLAPDRRPAALAPPEEHAAPLLEEQVPPREVVRAFLGVQDVAHGVRERTVAVPLAESERPRSQNDFLGATRLPGPAGFAVIVGGRYALTHTAALGGRSSLPVTSAAGQSASARVAAYDPATGVVLLELDGIAGESESPPAAPPGELLEAGALVVGVARWEQHDLSWPIFVTSVSGDRFSIAPVGGDVPPGTPLYTLSRELFAIAAGGDNAGYAFATGSAARRLIAQASASEHRGSLGVAYQALAPPLTTIFGDRGVLIARVVPGGPSDLAGVQPGDVLVAIGDSDIAAPDTANRLLNATTVGTAVSLHVLRNGRPLDLSVSPALAYDVAALATADEKEPSAPEAHELFSLPVLAAARVPATARVIAVAGRPPSSRQQVERLRRAARGPVPLLLRSGRDQFFAAIEAGRE